jgi:hypothetical protein
VLYSPCFLEKTLRESHVRSSLWIIDTDGIVRAALDVTA